MLKCQVMDNKLHNRVVANKANDLVWITKMILQLKIQLIRDLKLYLQEVEDNRSSYNSKMLKKYRIGLFTSKLHIIWYIFHCLNIIPIISRMDKNKNKSQI